MKMADLTLTIGVTVTPPREATALAETCCNRNMKPNRTLLRSRTAGYAYDLLRQYTCKVCLAERANFSRITIGKKGKMETMTEAKPIAAITLITDWLPRLQQSWQETRPGVREMRSDVVIELDALHRQTRGQMLASQETHLMAADTAKVYKAILKKATMNV